MAFIYFYALILIHPYLSCWWISFPQAGRKSWKALVPGYNYYVAYKISCHKPWWCLLLLFPGVHLVMLAVLNVSYFRRFGYFTLLDTVQGIFFPYILMFKISQNKDKALPDTDWTNESEVKKRSMGDHLALFFALPIIGHALAYFLGLFSKQKPGSKTRVKEWGDSLWFALIAAGIIRTYVFEPFQIPTGSMEKTLVVGDFLFVNKLAYGCKVPLTPLSYPLVHNTIPWINMKSYTSLEKGDYTRLPGFGKVKRNDVVVFNYPSGDTAVYDPRMPDGLMGHDYHGILINEGFRICRESVENQRLFQEMIQKNNFSNPNIDSIYFDFIFTRFVDKLEFYKEEARIMLSEDKIAHIGNGEEISHYGIIDRPVDKRENYIKRCVAIPRDVIEIKKSVLYVNGKKAFVPKDQNMRYIVDGVSPDYELMQEYGIEEERQDYYYQDGQMFMHLTLGQLALLKKDFPSAKFKLYLEPQYSDDVNAVPTPEDRFKNLQMFPKDANINNTFTDFSKIQIPFKGKIVDFTKDSIAYYRRIITAYEGHKLEEKKDGIYIDGIKTKTYKIEMNYYWLMGDNRYNSADSRVWGFVPEDHVVGRASLVWFSKSPYLGVRWSRLFKRIK